LARLRAGEPSNANDLAAAVSALADALAWSARAHQRAGTAHTAAAEAHLKAAALLRDSGYTDRGDEEQSLAAHHERAAQQEFDFAAADLNTGQRLQDPPSQA
jgi:hypothetical protein